MKHEADSPQVPKGNDCRWTQTSLEPIGIARFIWHLPNFLKLYVRLFRDRRVSLKAKIVGWGAVMLPLFYFVWPLDLIPDVPFIIFGHMEDVLIGLLLMVPGLRWFIKLCPEDVVKEHVAVIDKER